jgi:hypothetical protein
VLFVLLAILALLALIAAVQSTSKIQTIKGITTFKECADAGYPIQESYPEQCSTPDGRSFVNELQNAR